MPERQNIPPTSTTPSAPSTAGASNSANPSCQCATGRCAGLCTDSGLRLAHSRYRRPLLAVARRVVVDPHLAEEAVQEGFVRAWRACARFDPDGGPMLPWLVTITRNAAVDMVKARTRRPPVAAAPGDREGAHLVGGPEDAVLLRHELTAALGQLTPQHRTVVVETVVRGRPAAEVAAQLGLPPGTVRSRSHYALRRLRELIEAGRLPDPDPA